MDETDFKLRDLRLQLRQFSIKVDSTGKIIEIATDFENKRCLS